MVAGAALALAPAAYGYVGPGAGFAVVTSFFAVFVSFALAFFALLTWPVRRLIRAVKRRRALARARVGRVVILGLDGLSPVIARELMAAGKLPHLARLAGAGTFKPLATTVPAVSPVAWSSFQTGVSPARHNIFDFLARDRATYLPDLSSAHIGPPRRFFNLGRYSIPIGKPVIRLMRKSKPFWRILGEHGVFSSVIRVPITFPPEKFYGVSLSAMCVPDLLGTQGTFTHYVEGRAAAAHEGGQTVAVERAGNGTIRSYVPGPGNPLRRGNEPLRLPFAVRADKGGGATLEIDGTRYKLRAGAYTDWVPLAFRAGLGVRVRGAARFLLHSLEPFNMYMTPVNVDPDKPALPISHPYIYAVYLSKLLDRYATLGLAEDTWALNEGVIDEGAFLDQVWRHHGERRRMLDDALAKTQGGVVVCVFDTPDRVQHMFFRYRTPGHPANAGRDTTRYAGVIDEMYQQMDELVGATWAKLGPDDLFVVMSDHGFAPFARGVNLNRWLEREGYLSRRPGAAGGKWLADVDWSRTRAYALGLAGIYLNVKGREAQGIVALADVKGLKVEIKAKLTGLRDEAAGAVAVGEVYDLASIYDGPYLADGPELVAGYNAGWRASWDSATGVIGDAVFDDNVKAWSGDHCIASALVPGVLFSNARVADERPHIMDIAPTVLDLFGVAVPPHMEGKPLTLELAAGTAGENETA